MVRGDMNNKLITLTKCSALIILIGITALTPVLIKDAYILTIASRVTLTVALVATLVPLSGRLKLVSLGHAIWFGVGGYIGALLYLNLTTELALVLPLVTLITAIFALLCGSVMSRTGGVVFAILTLVLAQGIHALVFAVPSITNADNGLLGYGSPTIFGVTINSEIGLFYMCASTMCFMVGLIYYILNTAMGRLWIAIGANETRSDAIGIHVYAQKLVVFVIASSLAGFIGAIDAAYNGVISPESLTWDKSGIVLMYVLVGGMGSLWGPIIVTLMLAGFQDYIATTSTEWMIYFGIIFTSIILFLPGGLSETYTKLQTRMSQKIVND